MEGDPKAPWAYRMEEAEGHLDHPFSQTAMEEDPKVPLAYRMEEEEGHLVHLSYQMEGHLASYHQASLNPRAVVEEDPTDP